MRRDFDVEQRLWPRADVVGCAIALADGKYIGTYLLANLSASGALLVGDTQLSVGAGLRLLLQLHGRSRRFTLRASVVRHETGGSRGAFAVHFAGVPAHVEDALQSAVYQHLAAPPARQVVLVVHPDSQRAAWLQRDLVELAYETAVVHSALDAIAWLQATGRCAAVVVSAEQHAGTAGLALLEFISEDHPSVRRVLARPEKAPIVAREAAGSGRVHAVLEIPWTKDSLRVAVARPV